MTETTEATEATEYTRIEAAHYDAIRRMENFVRKAEYREEVVKRQYKFAKEKTLDLISQLRDLIHQGPDEQMKLPGMEEEKIERASWMDQELNIAIHSAELVKALAESNICTLGQLSIYMESKNSLAAISGVSEMGEAKIIESLQLFWEQNPDFALEQPPEPEAEVNAGSEEDEENDNDESKEHEEEEDDDDGEEV